LNANQTLISLTLPTTQHLEEEDFVQFFEMLKKNSTLLDLRMPISLRSPKCIAAVSDYIESNSGGIEVLKLNGFTSTRFTEKELQEGNPTTQIIDALSQNKHICKLILTGLLLNFRASLECISANHRIVELSHIANSSSTKLQKALGENRQLFQKECRSLLIRRIFTFQFSDLFESNVLKNIFQMSGNL
jgi:hypothetical protein